MWIHSLAEKQTKHTLLPLIEATCVNATVNVACTMVDAAWDLTVVMCTLPFKWKKTFNENEQ